jgi:hypothetical protein
MDKKALNKSQSELRRIIEGGDHAQAIGHFLHHHAMLHSAKMANVGLWSYEDEILDDVDEVQIRRIPHGREHSILWCIWHIARIEDVTMNLLVANTNEVFEEGQWLTKLNAPIQHTANALAEDEVEALSQQVDIAALREYRIAVGRRTREIVKTLEPGSLKKKVEQAQIERVTARAVIHPDAQGIIDYWSKRTIAGLLLMPASRHILVHLNEAAALKRKRV